MRVRAGATLSSDVPDGGSASHSMVLHCAPNATTVITRPPPGFGLTFDVVEDFSHLRFHWKTSKAFAFNASTAGYAMPLSLDVTYPPPSADDHPELGDVSGPDLGAQVGGFRVRCITQAGRFVGRSSERALSSC